MRGVSRVNVIYCVSQPLHRLRLNQQPPTHTMNLKIPYEGAMLARSVRRLCHHPMMQGNHFPLPLPAPLPSSWCLEVHFKRERERAHSAPFCYSFLYKFVLSRIPAVVSRTSNDQLTGKLSRPTAARGRQHETGKRMGRGLSIAQRSSGLLSVAGAFQVARGSGLPPALAVLFRVAPKIAPCAAPQNPHSRVSISRARVSQRLRERMGNPWCKGGNSIQAAKSRRDDLSRK